MNHGDVLYAIANTLPFHEVYIELGVQFGETYKKVSPLFARAIGVDLNYPGVVMQEFYRMTTDEFFEEDVAQALTGQVDLIFIDADHSHASSQKDFEYAVQIIKPLTGLIVLHDTYPANALELPDEFCSDSWRTAIAIRGYQGVESVTLPGMHGLTICRIVPNGRHLHWMD